MNTYQSETFENYKEKGAELIKRLESTKGLDSNIVLMYKTAHEMIEKGNYDFHNMPSDILEYAPKEIPARAYYCGQTTMLRIAMYAIDELLDRIKELTQNQ